MKLAFAFRLRPGRGTRPISAAPSRTAAASFACVAVILGAHGLTLSLAVAQDRDLNFNSEQQRLEAARYLYQIEGEKARAKSGLTALLTESRNEEVQTQARYLLGKIQDAAGARESALVCYKAALSGKGLQASEKLWLYRRLMSISPISIEPMVLDSETRGGPARAYASRGGHRTEYVLEFRARAPIGGNADGQWDRPKELGLQNEDGEYTPLDVSLGGHEEVLDASAEAVLILNQEGRRARLHSLQDGKTFEVATAGKIEAGALLSGAPGEFILIGSGFLRHYRAGKQVWEAPLEQEGCAWATLPDQPMQGIVQCAENQIRHVDIRKKTLVTLAGISDKPLQVASEGDFLAVRYIDRFEIRKGPTFASVKWGLASQLQEKLILGNAHVYLVTPKGMVKSYQLESGQLEWQKDMMASQLIAFDNELFATTFAQTVVCLDRGGKPKWTYEYGWDKEPLLLPNEEWLVLHYPDGKRVKLNRELLRVTGNSNGFKFMDYHAREAEKDWKGALTSIGKVLSLEPGNGEAWKDRSNILKNIGAPKQDQLECLVEAARSQETPNWSNGPVLKGMAGAMGASWVWKRQYGPKFYPNLIPHKDYSFYLENDNQTLVLINHETGELVNSYRFSEELDMKVSLWKNDTICVSSPSRIYLLSPTLNPGGLGQHPLKNPVCQAQAVPGGVVYSDWYGGLNMLGLPERTLRWERQLGQSGLLVGKAKTADYLDVLDLEGNYFAIAPASGKVLWNLKLPQGTITETFSNKDYIYAGYNQGTLICIDRARQLVAWTRDFGEQIFSLSGNRDNTLVLTTASKKLLCVQAATGAVMSEVRIQSYLFNRPTVTDHGYWLGTTEPALERRNFNHELLFKYKLPDLPGSPILFGNSIFIGTLDNFIFSFPI